MTSICMHKVILEWVNMCTSFIPAQSQIKESSGLVLSWTVTTSFAIITIFGHRGISQTTTIISHCRMPCVTCINESFQSQLLVWILRIWHRYSWIVCS